MQQKLPVIIHKSLILLPNQEVKIELNNIISKEVVNLSNNNYKRNLLVITPKNVLEEAPEVNDLPEVGVIAKLKSRIELPNGNIRVTIKGMERVKIVRLENNSQYEDMLEAIVAKIDLPKLDEVEKKATIKKLVELTEKYVNSSPHVSNSILNNLRTFDNLSFLTDMICSFLPISFNKKIAYIEEINALYRAKSLLEDLTVELEVLKLDEKLEQELQNNLEKNQREFILKEKKHIIEEELGLKETNVAYYKDKLASLNLSSTTTSKVEREIKKLEYTSELSFENAMIRNYLDWILNLPWHNTTIENNNLKDIKIKLDNIHYGLEDIKQRILEYVALKNNNSDIKSPIILLVGPPGVGKSSIAKNIATTLNRKFIKISVGSLNDSAELVGHRRTYMGSNPGKIIQGLRKCGSNNPLILIDEIDKINVNSKDDPTSVLLDILDKEQNNEFIDNYIEEPFNLSNIFFILTANSTENIPLALIDRLEVINLSSYTNYEKINIANNYLINRILEENKINNKIISITDEIMMYLIDAYTNEGGVRDLYRNLEKIIRKLVLLGKIDTRTKISHAKLKELLGTPIYSLNESKKEELTGRVNALAISNSRGFIIPIEACFYEGHGEYKITGMLGKIMEESTSVALSYIKSHINIFKLQDFYFNVKDIHVHFALSSAKKEGPSAGVAITTCILSIIKEKKINSNIAFTGEITLNGDIIRIGGVKEKIIGAYNNNITTIYLPEENESDLDDIPKEIRNKLTINFVNNYIQIYDALF